MSPDRVRQLIFQKTESTPLAPDCYHANQHLARSWKEFQAAHPDSSAVRVSTMNLMVVCSSPAEAEDLDSDLEQIVGRFPARVLVAVVDPEAHGDLTGWVSSACIPGKPHSLGSEVVGVHVPEGGERLPSLFLPLLRDGVPTFLWWRGCPPFDSPWFEHLVETSTRVILDSFTFMSQGLSPVAALVFDRYHREQGFSDLAWGRLRTWGQMVTGLFDRPCNVLRLSAVSQVEVEYWGEGDEPPPMPLYMAAWLAAKLRWELEGPLKPDEQGFVTRAGGVEIRLTRTEPHSPDLANRLVGVRFYGKNEEGDFEFGVDRGEADPQMLSLSGVFNRAHLFQALHLKNLAVLSLMASEFETLGRDQVFVDALKMALAMTGKPIPERKVVA